MKLVAMGVVYMEQLLALTLPHLPILTSGNFCVVKDKHLPVLRLRSLLITKRTSILTISTHRELMATNVPMAIPFSRTTQLWPC